MEWQIAAGLAGVAKQFGFTQQRFGVRQDAQADHDHGKVEPDAPECHGAASETFETGPEQEWRISSPWLGKSSEQPIIGLPALSKDIKE